MNAVLSAGAFAMLAALVGMLVACGGGERGEPRGKREGRCSA